jgi:hypothetical protein
VPSPAQKGSLALSLHPDLLPRLKAQAKRLRCSQEALGCVLLRQGLEQMEQSTTARLQNSK